MDGVLVKTHEGVLAVHGIDLSRVSEITKWNVEGQVGLPATKEDTWAPIVAMGADFWANLEPSDYAHELVELAGPSCRIITAPLTAAKGSCVDGKTLWIKRHFPHLERRMIFADEKGLCAADDVVLVDDSDKQVGSWRAAGGLAILWPQPWNVDYELDQREVLGRIKCLRNL